MYKKSEISWIIVVISLIALVQINLSYFNEQGPRPIPFLTYLIIQGIFVLIFLLFYKLTVIVGHNSIQLIYGIGLLRFNIQPRVIKEIEVVKTPWYYGLGIRFTPTGRIYNAHTLKAVKLVFDDDKRKIRFIGSPEPEQLKQAILENIRP